MTTGLRIGIVGTNFISDWFVSAAMLTDGRVKPVAVLSRAPETGEAFARTHDLAHSFTRLSDMAEVVDAVYIASPTIAHFPQAMEAIDAGCHVLIEKTMTADAGEAEAIFAAASERGVVAMEATRNLHAPAQQAIRAALPSLGALRYGHFEKLQYSSRYDRFRAGQYMNAFDPALGNSALADIGVYCVEPALDLFGVPDATTGTSIRLANGFEAGGSLQLDYGTMIVDVAYSKIVAGVGRSSIVGEEGALVIDDISEPHRIEVHERGGRTTVVFEDSTDSPGPIMSHELRSFTDQVDTGESDQHYRTVSIATRRLMDEHLARTAFPDR